jgi:hypothetical protein
VATYVDDMRAPLGRLLMSHMLADTDEELHAMADRIGVARRWFQGDHYDVCQTKRALAIEAGAVPVALRTMGAMSANRKVTGSLGDPATARSLYSEIRKARTAVNRGE